MFEYVEKNLLEVLEEKPHGIDVILYIIILIFVYFYIYIARYNKKIYLSTNKSDYLLS